MKKTVWKQKVGVTRPLQ